MATDVKAKVRDRPDLDDQCYKCSTDPVVKANSTWTCDRCDPRPSYPRPERPDIWPAHRLREARRRLGLTQRAFAEIMGVSQRSLQNWEARGLPPRQRAKLAPEVVVWAYIGVLERAGLKP